MKLVETAEGLTIAVGIEEPLHGFGQDGHLLERIPVSVQSFEIVASSAAILGRCRSPPGGAQRNGALRIERQDLLQPDI